MLYTLSQAHYDNDELQALLAQITTDDALVLWQDGVLQRVKFPQFFANVPNLFALQNDLDARGLTLDITAISLEEFVQLTERFFPQVAL